MGRTLSDVERVCYFSVRYGLRPSVASAAAAILAAGAAVFVAVVPLMMGLRCPPDSAMGAPSFVAALIFLLPLVEVAFFLVVRHLPISSFK